MKINKNIFILSFFAIATPHSILPEYSMGVEFRYEGDFNKASTAELSLRATTKMPFYKNNQNKLGGKINFDLINQNTKKCSLFCSQEMEIIELQAKVTLENDPLHIKPYLQAFPIYKKDYSPAFIENATRLTRIATDEINTIIYTNPLRQRLITQKILNTEKALHKTRQNIFEESKRTYDTLKNVLEEEDRQSIKNLIRNLKGQL